MLRTERAGANHLVRRYGRGLCRGFAQEDDIREPGQALDHAGAARVEDGRALVESPALIFDRLTFDGVEFDTFQYCRFVSRVIKTTGGWKLGSFEGIYQRDQMQTVDPRDPLPVDWDIVKSLRPSYKFIGYTQVKRGYKVNPELLGDDRPDLLEAFYARELKWLETGS